MATLLLLILMRKVDLLPPSMKDLQIFRFLKNGMVEIGVYIFNSDFNFLFKHKIPSMNLELFDVNHTV